MSDSNPPTITMSSSQPSLYESKYIPNAGHDISQLTSARIANGLLSAATQADPLKPLTDAGLKITKEYVDAKRWGERAILLHSVLTPTECAEVAQLTEQVEMLDAAKDHRYRNMLRCELSSTPLAKVLFARIAPFVEHVKEVTSENQDDYQQGELMRGKWELNGLNDHFRLCFYEGSNRGHFGPHFDGEFNPALNVCSMKTFMIYLANHGVDYQGGTTNFLNEHSLHFDEARQKFCAPDDAVVAKIAAKAGDLLIFDHKILHEGGTVLDGRKYIFRSELMYTRTSGPVMDSKEAEARDLLARARYHEDQNDGENAVKCYSKAFKLCPALEKLC